jgi:hypothetical protein
MTAATPLVKHPRKLSALGAAVAAAGDAAWDAVAAAGETKGDYYAKYNAARKAADAVLADALGETVRELQASAEGLLERMCAVGR